MSVANNGLARFEVDAVIAGVANSLIPLSPDGLSNVGTYFINAGLPCVTLGGKPRVAGQTYLEVDGGQSIDFHYGSAVVPDYDARFTCSLPTNVAGVSSSSSVSLTASSFILDVPVSSTLNKMDVVGAALVVPLKAPLWACYTATGVGNITVPACGPGQRFTLRNSTLADVDVDFTGGVTSMGGGVVPAAGIPPGESWVVSCIQVAPDVYSWGVAPMAVFP